MWLIGSSRVPEPEKHKYVQLIEFALDKSSFSPSEACSACSISDKEFRFDAPSVFVLNAYEAEKGLISTSEIQEWVLSSEAYFSYLEFLEFRYAIETSKRAYWLSVSAVILAIRA
jgi:hypothetical protein